jgi:hypothetical protein
MNLIEMAAKSGSVIFKVDGRKLPKITLHPELHSRSHIDSAKVGMLFMCLSHQSVSIDDDKGGSWSGHIMRVTYNADSGYVLVDGLSKKLDIPFDANGKHFVVTATKLEPSIFDRMLLKVYHAATQGTIYDASDDTKIFREIMRDFQKAQISSRAIDAISKSLKVGLN